MVLTPIAWAVIIILHLWVSYDLQVKTWHRSSTLIHPGTQWLHPSLKSVPTLSDCSKQKCSSAARFPTPNRPAWRTIHKRCPHSFSERRFVILQFPFTLQYADTKKQFSILSSAEPPFKTCEKVPAAAHAKNAT